MERYKKVLGIGAGVLAVVLVLAVVVFLAGGNQMKGGGVATLSMNGSGYGTDAVPMSESSRALGKSAGDAGFAESAVSVSVSPESVAIPEKQKVIRDASISMRVGNADEAVAKLRGVANWYKGTVASVNVWDNGKGVKSGSVTIEVPTESFDAAVTSVKETATVVVQETVSNQDVTSQFVDMEARLKNKKAEEESFAKILGTADKMADIIAITRELSRVRGEIEVMEGQMRYMSAQTEMATISVSLSEDQNVSFVETWRPWQEVKDTASRLLASLQGFVNFVIVALVWFLPLAILYGGLAFVVWIVVRAVYRKIRMKSEE